MLWNLYSLIIWVVWNELMGMVVIGRQIHENNQPKKDTKTSWYEPERMAMKREVVYVHLKLVDVTYTAWYRIENWCKWELDEIHFNAKYEGHQHIIIGWKHGPMNLCVLNTWISDTVTLNDSNCGNNDNNALNTRWWKSNY